LLDITRFITQLIVPSLFLAQYRIGCHKLIGNNFSGEKKILPKKATRNVTLAALLIEEVTRTLTAE